MTEPATQTTCYRHPGRVTGLRCTECGRPICGECSVAAPVGQRCPDCVRSGGTQRVLHGRDIVGRSSARRLPVTTTILAVTAGIHLLSFAAPGLWAELVARLAMWGPAAAEGEWWRMVTVTLVHANLTHILFNMLALWSLGPQIERGLGGARLVALYVSSAASGSAAAYFLGDPEDISVGASGAIFGLFGLWLASAVLRRSTAAGRALLSQLGVILAINAAIPFLVPNVSWQAHLGGLAGGFLLGLVWLRFRSSAVQMGAAVALLVLSVGSVALV